MKSIVKTDGLLYSLFRNTNFIQQYWSNSPDKNKNENQLTEFLSNSNEKLKNIWYFIFHKQLYFHLLKISRKMLQILEKAQWTPNSTRFIPLNYTQLSRNLFRKLPRLLSKLLRMGHRYILLKWDHFKTIFPDLFLMSLEKESQWWQ